MKNYKFLSCLKERISRVRVKLLRISYFHIFSRPLIALNQSITKPVGRIMWSISISIVFSSSSLFPVLLSVLLLGCPTFEGLRSLAIGRRNIEFIWVILVYQKCEISWSLPNCATALCYKQAIILL